MASSQNPNRIYFSSFDKEDNEKNTDFSITFDDPIQGAYNYEIVAASFPNLFKSFATYESILYLRFPAGLTAGVYAGKLIGIPLSASTSGGQIGAADGDPAQPYNSATNPRPIGIDGRYFLDATELETFLNEWFLSLTGGTYPAAGVGLRPFWCDAITNLPTIASRIANEISDTDAGTFFSTLNFVVDTIGVQNNSQRLMIEQTGANAAVNFEIPSFRETGDLDAISSVISQLQYKLGFTASTAQSSFTTAQNTNDHVLGPSVVNLQRTSVVFMASSLASGESLSSGKRRDILFSVSLSAPVGQLQTYQSSISGVVVNRPPGTIRNIRMTLLDENYEVMEALPENAAVVVEIHFTYNEEARETLANRQSTNMYR